MENLLNQIKQIRIKARLTQIEFASKIGISVYTVRKWELNNNNPSLRNIAKIEKVFNCELDYDGLPLSEVKVIVEALYDTSNTTNETIYGDNKIKIGDSSIGVNDALYAMFNKLGYRKQEFITKYGVEAAKVELTELYNRKKIV